MEAAEGFPLLDEGVGGWGCSFWGTYIQVGSLDKTSCYAHKVNRGCFEWRQASECEVSVCQPFR